MAEYREVFGRPKFAKLDPKDVSRLLNLIGQEATTVIPAPPVKISSHDSDNRFYECAEAAVADYIVTGNTRHFTRPHKTTKIATTREFLQLVLSRRPG
jgi:uncharacterized protein